MERRFDVRVPVANATLLEQLAQESTKTGIAESRLLVQYATRYVEMTKGGVLPLMAPGVAIPAQVATNGHGGEARDGMQSIQPSLDSASLDNLFGDPD